MFRVLLAFGIFFVGLGAFFFLGGLVSKVGQAITTGFGLVTLGLILLALYEIYNRLQKVGEALAGAERRQNQILDLLLRQQPMDVRLAVTNPLPGASRTAAANPAAPTFGINPAAAESTPLMVVTPAPVEPVQLVAATAIPAANFAPEEAEATEQLQTAPTFAPEPDLAPESNPTAPNPPADR